MPPMLIAEIRRANVRLPNNAMFMALPVQLDWVTGARVICRA